MLLSPKIAPEGGGIYFFYNANHELLYIGQTQNFKKRMGQYQTDYFYLLGLFGLDKPSIVDTLFRQRTIILYLADVKEIKFMRCSQRNLLGIESELIKQLLPPLNFCNEPMAYAKLLSFGFSAEEIAKGKKIMAHYYEHLIVGGMANGR